MQLMNHKARLEHTGGGEELLVPTPFTIISHALHIDIELFVILGFARDLRSKGLRIPAQSFNSCCISRYLHEGLEVLSVVPDKINDASTVAPVLLRRAL